MEVGQLCFLIVAGICTISCIVFAISEHLYEKKIKKMYGGTLPDWWNGY
jgi:hypothetical protein